LGRALYGPIEPIYSVGFLVPLRPETIHLGPGLFSKEKWVQAELVHPQSVEAATSFFCFRLSVTSAQKTRLLLRLEISSFMVDRSNVGILVSSIKCMTEGLTSLSFCRVRCGLNEVAYILGKLCEVLALVLFLRSVPECILENLRIDTICQ
jgi:hypothetical protein